MQQFTTFFNLLLSFGLLLYVIFLGMYFFTPKKSMIHSLISKHTLLFIFIISLIGTIASLIYSNVIGFPPCDLCWYQRIFVYSIAFISGYGFFTKKPSLEIRPYIHMLSMMGGIVSLYHNFVYYTHINPLPCSATASCTARYVFEFGFVTIPLMTLATLAVIFVLSTQVKKSD